MENSSLAGGVGVEKKQVKELFLQIKRVMYDSFM